jgi:hypothetical protein
LIISTAHSIFASDGHGGTLITDLPAGAVPGEAAAVTNTDQFIFRDFATRAHEKTVDNFKFGGSRFGLDFHDFDPNDESTFNARLFGLAPLLGKDMLINANLDNQHSHGDVTLLRIAAGAVGPHANDFLLPNH